MSNIWDRFNNIASEEEVVTAKAQFAPLDAGDYAMTLEEIKPDENNDHLPMIKGKLKIIDTGKFVFYNQNLQNLNYPNMTASNIADACIFLSGLTGEDVVFKNMSQFAEVVSNIKVGGTYIVRVSYGKKDLEEKKFPKLKIINKVDTEVPFDA